jgi:hypothetical protein
LWGIKTFQATTKAEEARSNLLAVNVAGLVVVVKSSTPCLDNSLGHAQGFGAGSDSVAQLVQDETTKVIRGRGVGKNTFAFKRVCTRLEAAAQGAGCLTSKRLNDSIIVTETGLPTLTTTGILSAGVGYVKKRWDIKRLECGVCVYIRTA